VPIIFLTALGDLEYVVRGLEMGADDYVAKPFRQEELLARIKAHLRRQQATNQRGEQLLVSANGRLLINTANRQLIVDKNLVELTPREFDLLVALVANAGRVVTTADLARKAWGLEDFQAQEAIKPYIHYLRKKIEEDPATPRWILAVRGVGYRFVGD
jgi:DNA-binding response OmpR family regulator